MARKRSRPIEQSHLEIIPMGWVDTMAVSIVAANLQSLIGLNVNTLSALADPQSAYLPLRGQYSAFKILNELEVLPGGARFKLGVAQFDICTPILKFVFGESQLGGKAAVISLHRLHHDNPERIYTRAAKIGLHETGHLLGVGHCRAPDCLMAFSTNIEKLDQLPVRFCSACEYEIARSLRHSFDQG